MTDSSNLFFNATKMLIIISILAHWSACLFLVVGLFEESDVGMSWLNSNPNIPETRDMSEKYVNALYFSVTTMCTIGYGDIRPVRNLEYIVVIMMELVAGILFAFIIASLGSLFTRYNLLAENYREK